MDTTKTITHISLCTGYGGIDLGLKRAIPNLRSIALCEIEAFAIANLVAKMEAGFLDPAPVWPDLKTFPWEAFRDRVDILTGGYPCQPFSSAGRRLGKDDPRHLWPWIAIGIQTLRPRFCFFENVEGHITLGLSSVISDLEEMGYRCAWGIFSASEVGAPHQRKRVFILANNQRERVKELGRWIATWTQQHSAWNDGSSPWPSRPGEQQYGWEPPRVVADNIIGGCDRRPDGTSGWVWKQALTCEAVAGSRGESHGMRQTQPPLGRDTDGASGGMDYAELCVSGDNRTDELRLLGNGVVPTTAELAFRTLIQKHATT